MKNILKIAIILSFIFTNISIVNGQENIFLLDENSLITEAKNNSPTIEKIQSKLLTAKINENTFLEDFQPKLVGNVSHFKSNEQTAAPFPVTSPTSEFYLGVEKDFTHGFKMGIYNMVEKKKYGSFGSDSKNAISTELTIDLYKNLFGYKSKAQIANLTYEKEIVNLQNQIDNKIFFINLQKIYWSIILNEEAIKISQNLLKTAKEQEIDAQKRYKDGVADFGEVARQKAQSASRQTEIFNLKNKKELYIRDLKEFLPSIANKNIELADYNIESKEFKIKRLVKTISQETNPPMKYTYYDDIIKLLEKSYKQQKKITKTHNDIDLELYSEYKHFENDKKVSDTYGDIHNYDSNSYQVGIRMTVPLGKTKKDTQIIKNKLEKANYLADKKTNLGKIEAYHSQTIKNIALLEQALKYQKENADNLKESLKSTKKKYNQARIPLRDLIEDQNFYLQSLLRELDIKLIIINQTLDYLTIFTQTPY